MTEDDLHTAWSGWPLLKGHPWEVYLTFTFPTNCNEERAAKLWKAFTDKAAKDVLPCRRARREGLPWLAAFERHKNGGTHIHALMAGVSELTFKQISDHWLAIAGSKIVDIKQYDPNGNALAYLTKAANTPNGEIVVARYFNYT
jgi:hypothetical protein